MRRGEETHGPAGRVDQLHPISELAEFGRDGLIENQPGHGTWLLSSGFLRTMISWRSPDAYHEDRLVCVPDHENDAERRDQENAPASVAGLLAVTRVAHDGLQGGGPDRLPKRYNRHPPSGFPVARPALSPVPEPLTDGESPGSHRRRQV